jgi:8-oxo-dGTP pyrophosphatase MutT (NUDIX family)
MQLVATHNDISWLPSGSTVEVWIGDQEPPPELVTASFAFLFADDGMVLMANVLKRGADIPGGHVESGETPENAIIRETVEETGAHIRILCVVGYLKINVPNPPQGYRYPTPVAYQSFYSAAVVERGAHTMPEECGEPLLLDPLEVAANPRFVLHWELLAEASRAFHYHKTANPPVVR